MFQLLQYTFPPSISVALTSFYVNLKRGRKLALFLSTLGGISAFVSMTYFLKYLGLSKTYKVLISILTCMLTKDFIDELIKKPYGEHVLEHSIISYSLYLWSLMVELYKISALFLLDAIWDTWQDARHLKALKKRIKCSRKSR